jgi:glycosyltransferase involved in cell wall biosynthesis
LSSGYRNRLIERGLPPERVSVIPSWGIQEAAVPTELAAEPESGTFTILFAGNMGPAQDLPVVLDAARRLKTLRPDIRFLFAGSGVDAASLAERAETDGLDNVRFLGRLPPRDMPPVFGAADALLVHLRDEPMFAFTVPSKTQSYLQAGKPILMGVRGDAAAMVAAAGAGIAFQPGNSEALATAAMELADLSLEQRTSMGRSGMRYYAENLSCTVGTCRFVKLFEDAVRRARAA